MVECVCVTYCGPHVDPRSDFNLIQNWNKRVDVLVGVIVCVCVCVFARVSSACPHVDHQSDCSLIQIWIKRVCVWVRVRACVRACVRARACIVGVCVRVRVCVLAHGVPRGFVWTRRYPLRLRCGRPGPWALSSSLGRGRTRSCHLHPFCSRQRRISSDLRFEDRFLRCVKFVSKIHVGN